jgi:hypothetical protein
MHLTKVVVACMPVFVALSSPCSIGRMSRCYHKEHAVRCHAFGHLHRELKLVHVLNGMEALCPSALAKPFAKLKEAKEQN